MSDSNMIDEPEAGQGEPEPVVEPVSDVPESQDDSQQDVNLSAEAKGWRLKFRDQQQVSAQLEQRNTDMAAKLQATQKALVDRHISSKVHNVDDFWSKVEFDDVLNEGVVDFGRIDTRLAEIVAENPHYSAPSPGTPGAASAPTSGGGKIGMRPFSVLDPSQASQPEPTWSDILQGGTDQMRP